MPFAFERLRKDLLIEALAEDLDLDDMAERFHAHRDSVRRALVRHGLREPRKTLWSPEKQRVATTLINDGVPLTWVAETIGVPRESLSSRGFRRGEEESAAYRSVWQEILKNPVLLELHREFAPKPSRHMTAKRTLSAFAAEEVTGWTYSTDPNCTPTEGSPAVEGVPAVTEERLVSPAVEYQAAVYGERPLISEAVAYQAAVTKTEYLYKQLVTGKEKWLDSLTWNPGLGWYYAQQMREIVVTPEVLAQEAVYGEAPLISAEVLAQDAIYETVVVKAAVEAQAAVPVNDCQVATARWILPDGGTSSNVTWPQAIASQANLDAILCGETVTIQVDDYPYGTAAEKARTDALGPVLEYGEDHGWARNWRFETFTSEDCAQSPGPNVETYDSRSVDCQAEIVSTITYTRTAEPVFDRTSNTWSDGEFGKWVAGEPQVIDADDTVCPPPVTPETPDTATPDKPNVAALILPDELPQTGLGTNPVAGLVAGLALGAAGVIFVLWAFIRRLRQI